MQRDRYEGESMIIPGEEDTHGTTFQKYNNAVLGWYECHVDTTIEQALITDPVTFQDSWKDCYIMYTKTKRTYQTDWADLTDFLPVEDWDITDPSDPTDISDIKNHLEALSRLWLFEPNGARVRENFKFAIELDLDVFKAQGDIYDYCVVCDESNNTPYTVDCDLLQADVAIKPAKTAEFIFIPISVLLTQEEDPKPIKSTLVKPGITVTVTDESIYISKEMVDEWNYERAMKIV